MNIRDHFVYTAFDSKGRVLYVGCTKNLTERKKAHRSDSDWFYRAARFHIRGPFTYEAGRQVERDRLAIDRPLYGFHPARRTLAAIHERVARREMTRLIATGVDYYDAIAPAYALARGLTGYTDNRAPINVTDEVLADAFRREREHADSMSRGAA